MVERFKQQDLASAQTGVPQQDNSGSTAAALISQAADAVRDRMMQSAAQDLARADQSFNELAYRSQVLNNQLKATRDQERKRFIAQDIDNKSHMLSMQLRDLERATKKDFLTDPAGGAEAFNQGASALAETFIPKGANKLLAGEYRKKFGSEIGQATDRIYGWQEQTEKETIRAAVKENQKRFLLSVGQEADPDTAMDMFSKYQGFLHNSSPRMSTAQHLDAEETIRKGIGSFVNTVAKQNPAKIEDAITIAKGIIPGTNQRWFSPSITEEDAEGFRDTARQSATRLENKAIEQTKNVMVRKENQLENQATVIVQNALSLKDVQNPTQEQIDQIQAASEQLRRMAPSLQSEMEETTKALEANPQDKVLLVRQESLNKQIKLILGNTTKLDNTADSIARTIDVRNQIAAARATAEATRQSVEAQRQIAKETRLAREEARVRAELTKAEHAQMDLEVAELIGRGADSGKINDHAQKIVRQIPDLKHKLEVAEKALTANPDDKRLQTDLAEARKKVEFAAAKTINLTTKAKSMQDKELAEENRRRKEKAQARIDILKSVSAIGDIKSGLEARVNLPWVKLDKKGRFKSDIASYSEAEASLRKIGEQIHDAYTAGVISASERDQLSAKNQKNTAEIHNAKQPWQDWLSSQMFAPVTEALNKPLNDFERKNLLIPGTPQYKKFLGSVQRNAIKTLDILKSDSKITQQDINEDADGIAHEIIKKAIAESRR